jgi:hypothetical protein
MLSPTLLLAPLLALAPDAGPLDVGDGGAPVLALHPLQVRNLGATTVQVELEDAHGVRWGPFALDSHETVTLHYCPTAGLSLTVKSVKRAEPLRYALERLVALKISEDRWSEGDPLRVYDTEGPALVGTCARAFTAGR